MNELAASYRLCRRLHAQHGRTYYLASLLLPRDKRRAVHALYGFARYIDDVVDVPLDRVPDPGVLDRVRRQLDAGLQRGASRHPILAATVDAVIRFDIDPQWLHDFLDSMRTDLFPRTYATWGDLSGYTWGSASVIGLQLTRIIGTSAPETEARPPATALGEAFQLTNFLRDYDEDRSRGRVYLPVEEFTRVGIEPGAGDSPQLREVIASGVARTRELYRQAEPGIAMLHPEGRDCIRTAFTLYQGILDEIEASGYDVVSRRHRVALPHRLSVAAAAYPRSLLARARPTDATSRA
ncbi:squalene/phytoene synthase family protein [Epidermidibacterium keratini]|uniref:Squalene/phytoene synthase family protein n=1 Tax=Epidermidibacterium keratini TaxID=1891644 RepID=A0A7L4YJT9_9ACTN|nr:phytoene/squalene synthase family protein [Epidermidibacterium keratini]QHB99162.1 squalene/phytoene synthase family protein [Epidermidibacterium keratini]